MSSFGHQVVFTESERAWLENSLSQSVGYYNGQVISHQAVCKAPNCPAEAEVERHQSIAKGIIRKLSITPMPTTTVAE